MRRSTAGIHPGGAAPSSSWDAFYSCVYIREEGGILATAPEAIVYYSSGRLVCWGRGFKRGSPSRKNFFSSPSVRTRRRLSFSSALLLFFFFSSRQNPHSRLQFTHLACRHMATLALRLRSLSLLCHEALIHGASAGGGREVRRRRRRGLSLSLSHAVPLKRSATVCKLCCREAQRRGLRN